VVWSDRLTIAEMRQRTNTDIVAAAHIHKWEWGKTCDTNGPTPTDTRYSIVGYKDGQNKNVATEDPMGKYVQENIRKTTVTNSKKKKKTSANGVHTHKIGKSKVTRTFQVVVKHCRSPWFHQQAVALKGLTWLIYFYIY
jgi:hypothetical protein